MSQSARGKRRVVQRFEGVVEESFDGGAYITVAFGTKRLRGVVLDDASLAAAAAEATRRRLSASDAASEPAANDAPIDMATLTAARAPPWFPENAWAPHPFLGAGRRRAALRSRPQRARARPALGRSRFRPAADGPAASRGHVGRGERAERPRPARARPKSSSSAPASRPRRRAPWSPRASM